MDGDRSALTPTLRQIDVHVIRCILRMVGVWYPVILTLWARYGIHLNGKVVVFFSGASRPFAVREPLRRSWCPVSISIAHRSLVTLQHRMGLFAILFTSRRIKLYMYMYARMQYNCLHICRALFHGVSSIPVNCFARRYCLACVTRMITMIRVWFVLHILPFCVFLNAKQSAAWESIEWSSIAMKKLRCHACN